MIKGETEMQIEIHIIQNHSPSNLNRDDLGAPKTCLFGGVTRARISSQCLKRSIRRSPEFQQALEKDGGVRTRRLITILAEEAHGSSPAPAELLELVAKAFEKGGVKRDPTKGDANATNILLFVPETAIAAMANEVRDAAVAKRKPEQLCQALTKLLGEAAAVPDIALCGRMTEVDPSGMFHDVDLHVDAALSVAHAISTHAVVNEVDYFVAADDRPMGMGASHVNEAMYNSACFYKYFSIDWHQLLANLNGNRELAEITVRQFLLGAALSTPSGKLTSFAQFNPPEGILVEVKTASRTAASHANAFAAAVPLECPRGLIGESIARLGQHVHEVAEGYRIEAERFWFSPCGRHRLTYVADGPETDVVNGDANVSTLQSLVDAVMGAVTTAASAKEA